MLIKMRKQDRDLLALMAQSDTNPHARVYYVPGREHATNPEARTRYKYERYQPATYGFKTYVRVTAPVERLLDAGLVEHRSSIKRCPVTLTQEGHDWLAEYQRQETACSTA